MGKKKIPAMPKARTFTLHPRSRTVNDTRAECSRRAMMTYAVYIRQTDPEQGNGILDWIEQEILYQRKLAGLKPISDIEAIKMLREKYGDGKVSMTPIQGGIDAVKKVVEDFNKKEDKKE